MVWWADAWEKNKFGMQFTADTADQFMDRNAAGPDVISNAAEGCANTAEAIQQAFGPGFKDAMKEAALEKQYDKIYAYIKELKGKIEMQDPGLWDTVVGPMMIRRVINTFLQDKKARGFTRSLADTLSGRASSISETYTETEDFHRPWSWDASDVLNFLEGAVGLTSGKVIPKELMKEMRKYSRSLGIDIFLNHFLPIFGMVSIALFVSFMRSAAKENEKNN